ncbi:hypothetical protein NIES2119_31800 [[Phormidium ambiguum] IAM M-71]|uniref:Uncharacterized protein n=1 Tax=[Phormidium ambiguum] IAM M-71 TaxID=454136 RepID=A0A1U7I1U7_9CYAN|nr:hypothetical protein [Phormidium ambiguum]OKH29955.1 hypothetical protein NIES2119_31800 [Phormidium ambiguum IAM M-71]
MLTVFATELNLTQSELDALLAKVDALRGQMKSLKAAQNKAFKVVDNLKNLVSELPEMAIAELKKEILSLFPSNPEPTKDSAEIFTNFVTEIPKTEVTTPEIAKNEEVNDRWNSADFEPLEYQAENNGQPNLLRPTTTEPPEPDDFANNDNAIDLSAYREAWEQWEKTNRPVKVTIAPVEEEAIDDDSWPEIEPITPVVEQPTAEPAPKPTDNNYAQTEYINDTVCYIKKFDGELLAGYIGTATKKLASEWADLLVLWGCNATARKAQRIGKGIRWEVKITKISMEQLITAANNHPGLYSAVPAGNTDYSKKSLSGNKKTEENLSDSKTVTAQSNLQNESLKATTNQNQANNNDAEDEAIEAKLIDQLGLKLEEDNSDFTCPEWVVWHDNGKGERQAIGRIRKHLTRESNPWLHSDLSGLEITKGLGYPSKYAASRALLAKYQAKADK